MTNPSCPSCGQMNPPGVTNCFQCGAPLTATPPQSAQSWGTPPGQSGPGAWPPQQQGQAPGAWPPQQQGQAPGWGPPQQSAAPGWQPPGQNYGMPPPYGQQQFGGGAAMFSPAVDEAKKTARNALVAGLVGLLCFGFILGALAIKWGKQARSSLQAAGVGDGQGMALAGMILGIIDIIGWVLWLVLRIAGS